MNKIINLGLGLSFAGSFIGYVLSESYKFGICTKNDLTCSWFFERTGDAVFLGSLALLVVFVLLFFIPNAYGAWKKFAKFFLPVAFLIFALYQDPRSGDLFSPVSRDVFQWVGMLYIVISGVIIAVSWYRNRSQNKPE